MHGVGDGIPWIAAQCLRRFGPKVGYRLDLFHACDYLTAVWPGDYAPLCSTILLPLSASHKMGSAVRRVSFAFHFS